MRPSIVAYLVVMSAVTLGTRILPLTLIRRPISNRFLRSFLYYVPYVTLAVMTFPAILSATDSPLAGATALVVGIVAAWLGASGELPVWRVPPRGCGRVVWGEPFESLGELSDNGVVAAWFGASLPHVAAGCCGVVFALELLLA